jgi:hypothetical protein
MARLTKKRRGIESVVELDSMEKLAIHEAECKLRWEQTEKRMRMIERAVQANTKAMQELKITISSSKNGLKFLGAMLAVGGSIAAIIFYLIKIIKT